MVNYANGKIYRIVCNTTGLQYIGSTTRPLSERLNEHKNDYRRFQNNEHNYVTSFEILKNNNYEIVLIENVACNNKEELHRQERYYIEKMTCINKVVPQRTKKEYTEDHKEKFEKYHQDYYRNNIDTLNIYHSQYRLQNREIIREKNRKFYQNNPEKYKEYRQKNTFTCICGLCIQTASKSRHLKSKKHLAYLESLKETN